MSNLRMVLDIAANALAAQQHGMDVTAHNIANVNTDGYSRQIPNLQAERPMQYQGLIMGVGVKTEQVTRCVDQFVENKLMQEKSNLSSSQEMETYMQVLEGIFSENSESSISSMLSDYWNLWNDISNNPSGSSERIALYEHSVIMSEQFKSLDPNLNQIQTEITKAVTVGVERINQITSEIAQINVEIVGMETNNKVANDLRDQRNVLVSELNEYLDVKAFEQSNSSLTILMVRGCTLVQGDSNYELEMRGSNGDRVKWQDSGGNYVDITNHISNGKLGALLNLRDSIIPKYELDLDAMTKEFIWFVNRQHSQGVGLEAFGTVTGTYTASNTTASLNSSGLGFADKIVDGGFRLWLYDSNGNYDSDTTLIIDADVTSMDDIVNAINTIDNTKINATIVDGKLNINGVNGYTFGFSDDTSNVLAAFGINTFFKGTGIGNIDINDTIGLDKNYVAAAKIANNVGSPVANSGNSTAGTGTIVTSGHYTGATNATYEIQISTGGSVGVAEFQWRRDGGAWSAATATTGSPQLIENGMSITFIPGTYVINDTFSIDVTANSTSYGEFASGDNDNALAITDLQYTSMDISQWTCDRINGNTEGSVTTTIEDYYHSMVGSIGILSSSISMEREYNEMMIDKLNTLRDSISAVSLDEEMTNLIKYQHAYQAAAKLITISDEMLNTLISVR